MRKIAYHNWYNNLKDKDLITLHNLLDRGVYLALVNAKKDPTIAQRFADYSLQKQFLACEQAAQKILHHLSIKQLDAAKQTLQSLQNGLKSLCTSVQCHTNRLFKNILDNVENSRILLNNIVI